MISSLIKMYKIIGEFYPALEEIRMACEDRIKERESELTKQLHTGSIKKTTFDRMLKQRTVKYQLTLERIKPVKDAMKEFDQSITGGL